MIKKILVTVDGSDNSMKALERAKYLAELSDAEILILHVINDTVNNPYITLNEYKKAIDDAFLEQANIIIDGSVKKFRDSEVKIDTILKHGDPGKKIIETAEKENCDLIIMGSRGLNALSRVMLGSVSNKVLNHSKVSVLIVK